jgi:hypothetical protein
MHAARVRVCVVCDRTGRLRMRRDVQTRRAWRGFVIAVQDAASVMLRRATLHRVRKPLIHATTHSRNHTFMHARADFGSPCCFANMCCSCFRQQRAQLCSEMVRAWRQHTAEERRWSESQAASLRTQADRRCAAACLTTSVLTHPVLYCAILAIPRQQNRRAPLICCIPLCLWLCLCLSGGW